MKKPTPAILTLAAFTIAALTGCTGSSDPTTSTSTSSSSTTSSSTTSTTSSSSTSTTADGTQQAEQTVLAFYKEMDQLGKGELDINKITTWTTLGTEGGTVAKWSNSVGELVYGRKLTQVGDTVVSDLSSTEVSPPKSDVDYKAAYEVIACIDRSGVTFEDAKGKPAEVNAGVADKTLVTHLLVAYNDTMSVVRDTPGKSC